MKGRANIVVGALVALVLACALGAYAFMQMGAAGAGAQSGALRAVVHDGEGGVHELVLDQDQEQVITTALGTNVVVVEDGAVFVREADCDNLDCVHQGKLSAPGRQIICLPHKLWIEVVAPDGTGAAGLDESAVAGGDAGERAEAGNLDAIAR